MSSPSSIHHYDNNNDTPSTISDSTTASTNSVSCGSLRVKLHHPRGTVYFPNGVVSGTLLLALTKPLTAAREIRVSIQGINTTSVQKSMGYTGEPFYEESLTLWQRPLTNNSQPSPTTQSDNVSACFCLPSSQQNNNENQSSCKCSFAVERLQNSTIIPPGEHRFRFSFRLPNEITSLSLPLPSSHNDPSLPNNRSTGNNSAAPLDMEDSNKFSISYKVQAYIFFPKLSQTIYAYKAFRLFERVDADEPKLREPYVATTNVAFNKTGCALRQTPKVMRKLLTALSPQPQESTMARGEEEHDSQLELRVENGTGFCGSDVVCLTLKVLKWKGKKWQGVCIPGQTLRGNLKVVLQRKCEYPIVSTSSCCSLSGNSIKECIEEMQFPLSLKHRNHASNSFEFRLPPLLPPSSPEHPLCSRTYRLLIYFSLSTNKYCGMFQVPVVICSHHSLPGTERFTSLTAYNNSQRRQAVYSSSEYDERSRAGTSEIDQPNSDLYENINELPTYDLERCPSYHALERPQSRQRCSPSELPNVLQIV